MSIVNKGNAEKRKEKKRQVLYRIAMKNPYAEMLSCDFIEVAKLKHGLVAIQVCPDSDPVWKEMPSNCRDVCKSEQVNFVSPICEANSGGKALKRVSKHSSKRVPGTTAVLSVARKKITSRRRLRCHSAGPELELKSILYPKENKTGFRDVKRTSNSESASVGGGGGALEDGFVSLVHEHGEAPLSTSSLCLKELQESTPGWPLLRTAVPVSEEALSKSEARELSVVQWVMSLPNRSCPVIMRTQNEENDNSIVHDEWEIETTSVQVVQTSEGKSLYGNQKDENLSLQAIQASEDKSMDGSENTENEDFGHASEYKGQVSQQQSMLGWPLLQKTASATPEAFRESKLANKLTVVQWAMKLPDRNQIGLGSNTIESTPLERETNDSEVNENNINSPAVSAKLPKELDLHKTNSSGCRWFSYEELKRATSQFSSENLIGEGGCSSVYKGRLPCGQPVAVKISKSYKEAWNNFSQEINITTLLNHKYIAPLIGICVEDSHLISVYDFVPKGSLEENLHGDRVLPWEVRFKVAVVVAEALNYLHDECSPPVIHRDIKSSNILLSDDFQPQLSDFGLALMGPTDSTEILDSDVVGTFGYIAPEYFMHGRSQRVRLSIFFHPISSAFIIEFSTMPFLRIAIGQPQDTYHPDALKKALAEFFGTLIFVFAGEGSGMAFSKLTDDGSTTPAGLIAEALGHGLGLFVAVSGAWNISGGHINPAVTFGAFVGGNITLLRGILYWIAQLLGSAVACLLLKFCTHGMTTSAFAISSGETVWNAFVLEIVMTFGLVYTVYATAIDPRNGNVGIIAPLAIGLIVAANILAGGAFDGASMNPAMSFGPALVSWDWTNHWVYWAGPLIGGGIAGLIYEHTFITHTHEPLPGSEF